MTSPYYDFKQQQTIFIAYIADRQIVILLMDELHVVVKLLDSKATLLIYKFKRVLLGYLKIIV